ncbi:MAG: hypothetical protein KC910_00980 [Candidatus Eremiobacteraeota bacterium]|nr:hypothetical protein [Candidatus Eremiobacteraeota bacterium]
MGGLFKTKIPPFASLVAICGENCQQALHDPLVRQQLCQAHPGEVCSLGDTKGEQLEVLRSALGDSTAIKLASRSVALDPVALLVGVAGADICLRRMQMEHDMTATPEVVGTLLSHLNKFRRLPSARMLANALAKHETDPSAALNGFWVYFSLRGDLPRGDGAMNSGATVGMWYSDRAKQMITQANKA